jgi:preprotein translocase subunit SecA
MSGMPPPRPGPVLGAYPERDAPPTGRFDQFADQVIGGVRALGPKGPGRYRGVVRRIAARGEHYGALDDQQLAEAVLDLRRRLRLEGLADAVCIDAFALVREQSSRVLGMRHFDVQMLGGWVMLQGMVAEMQTGEGKTLTATLPAATAAMAGVPVHIVTVNDYLVRRDAELMGPLYRALGLSVGAVVEGMSPDERRAAYACDLVYCTNKQLVFDYLRDRLVRGGLGQMRMRLDGLFGNRAIGDRLLLRGLCFAILDEADSVLVDEARTPLIISRGADGGEQATMYQEALELADGLEVDRDYRLDPVRREIELTDAGKDRLTEVAATKPGVWAGTRRREELVRQALYAQHLLVRDRHYLIKDDKVQIIDEYTGRLMPDRSWERGLHQLVEAKEGVEVTAGTETLARISYQRFFRRYLLLAGMTGTAREVCGELWSVYHLGLVRIPTNRPLRRRRLGGSVFRGADAKWSAVVEQIDALHGRGRPVLVGTTSVGASEHLSGLLGAAGIPHRVLNARQDRDEAETIAEAGQPGAVTVATNMAGRGTDIKLGPGVAELGGLHVIATERHEAGRIDRQLYGRCGRQGDPGSFQYLVSLEDGLITQSPWRGLVPYVPALGRRTGMFGRLLVRWAQRSAERRHGRIRRQLLRLDEQMGRMLAFSGRME